MVGGVRANEFDRRLTGDFDFTLQDQLAIGVFFPDVVSFLIHDDLAYAL